MDFKDTKLVKRFWSKVSKGAASSCWPWLGRKNSKGYGQWEFGGEHVQAHRAALSISVGESQGAQCLHSCDYPACCNPEHLRWGTNAENQKEKFERNAEFHAQNLIQVLRLSAAKRLLLPSQAEYLAKLMRAGFTAKQCSEWYGVSRSVCYRIARGESYAR